MAKEQGHVSPNDPGVSDDDLRELTVDELRHAAKEMGVEHTSHMHKDDLVREVGAARRERAASEADLREMTVDELRHVAKEAGVGHTSSMRKDDLIREVAAARRAAGGGGAAPGGDEKSRGAGPDAGHVRTGPDTSKSLKYSQEITSPDEEPERPGRSLATSSHDVIREWAEARGGRPATVEGSEHGDHLGVLRFDFGDTTANLRQVSWDEWFATFDDRRLNFIYQEERTDGRQSNFFRLENPEREDA